MTEIRTVERGGLATLGGERNVLELILGGRRVQDIQVGSQGVAHIRCLHFTVCKFHLHLTDGNEARLLSRIEAGREQTWNVQKLGKLKVARSTEFVDGSQG